MIELHPGIRSKKAVRRLRKVTCEVIVTAVAILFLYPIALIYINAFKPNEEILLNLLALPSKWTAENIVGVLSVANYGTAVANTCLFVCVFIPIVSILACMAGYMIGRTNDRKSHLILSVFMVSMAIPFSSVMLPLFMIMGKMGLVNTRIGYCCVAIPLLCPAYIFFYSAHVASLPKELEESAITDGCGLLRCFFSIIFPLSTPVTVTVSVLVFMAVWNDFLFPSLVLRDASLRTVTLLMQKFQGAYQRKWNMLIACTALIMTPSLILYVCAQKYIMRGMIAGAIKG